MWKKNIVFEQTRLLSPVSQKRYYLRIARLLKKKGNMAGEGEKRRPVWGAGGADGGPDGRGQAGGVAAASSLCRQIRSGPAARTSHSVTNTFADGDQGRGHHVTDTKGRFGVVTGGETK